MVDDCLLTLLRRAEPGQHFPATEIYNEGWMLRLVLDWFCRNRQVTHQFGFSEKAKWYSEALLPSTFRPRYQGDKLGESRTHADGVIGHLAIEANTKAGLVLKGDATQFVVIEAKMFSGLSKGVTHARYYDQAARTVACMAEVVNRVQISLTQFERLAFYVVAPRSEEGKFLELVNKEHIQQTVKRRVSEYQDEQSALPDKWFDDWFLPIFQKTETSVISWEEILNFISSKNVDDGKAFKEFYEQCLECNKPASQKRSS